MRANEFLLELFDPKHAIPLKWRNGGTNILASGQLNIQGEPMTLDINFGLEDDNIVNIEFSVAGSYDLTGKGGSTQVFSTVIEAVKHFVSTHPDVTAFTFTADEKSRARMYDTLTKRVAKEIGFDVMKMQGIFASYCPLMIESKLRLVTYVISPDEEFQSKFPDVISKAEKHLRSIIDKFNL